MFAYDISGVQCVICSLVLAYYLTRLIWNLAFGQGHNRHVQHGLASSLHHPLNLVSDTVIPPLCLWSIKTDLTFLSQSRRVLTIMTTNHDSSYHYIIVGAGIAGVVVAARLHEKIPSASILLVEAGGNESDFELANVQSPLPRSGALGSTTPTTQSLRNTSATGRQGLAGHAFSGGGAINVGGWSRGAAAGWRA